METLVKRNDLGHNVRWSDTKYRDIADGNTIPKKILLSPTVRSDTKYRDIADGNESAAALPCPAPGRWKPSTAL